MDDTLNRFARYLLRNYSEDAIRERLAKYPPDDKRNLTRALIAERDYLSQLTEEQKNALAAKDDIASRRKLTETNK